MVYSCENITEKYQDFCLSFYNELREKYGFKLSAQELLNFFKISENIDITDENSVMENMKMFFCHTAEEVRLFPEIFKSFYYSEELGRKIENTIARKRAGHNSKNVFLQKKQTSSVGAASLKLTPPDFKCERFFASFEMAEGICEYSSFIHAGFLNLYDDFARAAETEYDPRGIVESINDDLLRFVSFCKKVLDDPLRFAAKAQEISAFFQMIIRKNDEEEESEEEKEEKTDDNEAVRGMIDILEDDRIPMAKDLCKKDLRLLTKKDIELIKRYISENAHKLKGRINRNQSSTGKREFDIKTTIKGSFKTGMIPIYLSFKEPGKRKVKIVCMLDISPSCISAASILIYLLHALESSFKGMSVYSFADSANDITPMLRAETAESCISKMAEASKGSISDYTLAFESFNNVHFHEIKKNTVFLILGDMRNNYRRFKKEGLAKIHSKVISGRGKVILLNTDPKRRWYKDDSILKQAESSIDEIYEVRTVDDIIKFLSNLSL